MTWIEILEMVGQHMGRTAWMFGAPIDPRLFRPRPPPTGWNAPWPGTSADQSHGDELVGPAAAWSRREAYVARERL